MPVVVPFVDTSVLIVELGMKGATGNVYAGLHDFGEMSLLLHFLRPEDVFVDVGANIGSYSILAGGVVGAKTFAFEPIPRTFSWLIRNLRINNVNDRVVARQIAIGAETGEQRFSADRDTQNSVVSDTYEGDTVLISSEKLDDAIGNARPAMIKIDVEGFESAVIDGAVATLAMPELSVVIIEGRSAHCEGALRRAGFQEINYDPFARCISPAANDCTRFCNHIWVRNVDQMESRCRDSRTYRVLEFDV